MASVLEVLELSDGITGGASIETGSTHTRMFSVEFDGINKHAPAAIVATDGTNSVPAYGAVHPTDAASFVVEKTASPAPDSNGWHWIVTVNYKIPTVDPSPSASPDAPGVDGAAGSGSPPGTAIHSTKFSWGFWTKTSAPERDIAGDLICNSAGDLFDTPPTRDDELAQLTVTRTQSSLAVDWLINLNNCLNIAAFTIGTKVFAAKTLKCNITAEKPVGDSGGAWQVTIVLRHDPAGWDWSLLNAGFYKKVAGVAKPVQIFIEGGLKPARPQLLDAAGDLLAVGAAPTYKAFRKYYLTDFDYLGLEY